MPQPLLIGTYETPPVAVGERVWCHYRRAICNVTSFTAAPIPWPLCHRVGSRGGTGLWVNATLKRAILTESADALKHWFGVSAAPAWQWRKAFGVGRTGTEGSKALHRATSAKGAAAMKAKVWTDKELRKKSRAAKKAGLKPDRWTGRGGWTDAEKKLLDTFTDDEVAARTSRTTNAVRAARRRIMAAGRRG
jgi:hypothetical protein